MPCAGDVLNIGLEEGMHLLPSHILDEAFHDYGNPKNDARSCESSLRTFNNHTTNQNCSNWASTGDTMRVFFLEHSGQKPRGTGVFLPQRPGAGSPSNRKPACSPVILPSRVVRALNLNLHGLSLQISPPQDMKTRNLNPIQDESSKAHISTKRPCAVSSCSRGIFLPKEWSY